MIRRNFLYLVALTLVFTSCNNTNKELENWKKVYENTQKNGDYSTAIVALNHLLIIDTDSSHKASYIDSLAHFYTKKENNFQAGKVFVDKGLAINPNNVMLLEYKGGLLAAENQPEKALEAINKAYKISGSNKYLYMHAAMQHAVDKNLENYVNVINKILYSGSKPEMIDVNVDASTSQKVDIRATCYMDKAKIASNFGTPELMMNYLDSALMLAPDYQEALYYKENLLKGSRK